MKWIKFFKDAAAVGSGVDVDKPNVSWLQSSNVLFVPGNSGTATVKYNSTTGEIEVESAPAYEYVDLGLSVLWAKCNVGANTETDYGLYFAWGETTGYTAEQVGNTKVFDAAHYQWSDGGSSSSNMTKYNSTDGKTVLDLEDDAAHVNMGGNWRMPTLAQFNELKNNTIYQWVTNYNGSGINGCTFTGNGQTLFIPAAGYVNNSAFNYRAYYGYIWFTSLSSNKEKAFIMSAEDPMIGSGGDAYSKQNNRWIGCSVRGVLPKN